MLLDEKLPLRAIPEGSEYNVVGDHLIESSFDSISDLEGIDKGTWTKLLNYRDALQAEKERQLSSSQMQKRTFDDKGTVYPESRNPEETFHSSSTQEEMSSSRSGELSLSQKSDTSLPKPAYTYRPNNRMDPDGVHFEEDFPSVVTEADSEEQLSESTHSVQATNVRLGNQVAEGSSGSQAALHSRVSFKDILNQRQNQVLRNDGLPLNRSANVEKTNSSSYYEQKILPISLRAQKQEEPEIIQVFSTSSHNSQENHLEPQPIIQVFSEDYAHTMESAKAYNKYIGSLRQESAKLAATNEQILTVATALEEKAVEMASHRVDDTKSWLSERISDKMVDERFQEADDLEREYALLMPVLERRGEVLEEVKSLGSYEFGQDAREDIQDFEQDHLVGYSLEELEAEYSRLRNSMVNESSLNSALIRYDGEPTAFYGEEPVTVYETEREVLYEEDNPTMYERERPSAYDAEEAIIYEEEQSSHEVEEPIIEGYGLEELEGEYARLMHRRKLLRERRFKSLLEQSTNDELTFKYLINKRQEDYRATIDYEPNYHRNHELDENGHDNPVDPRLQSLFEASTQEGDTSDDNAGQEIPTKPDAEPLLKLSSSDELQEMENIRDFRNHENMRETAVVEQSVAGPQPKPEHGVNYDVGRQVDHEVGHEVNPEAEAAAQVEVEPEAEKAINGQVEADVEANVEHGELEDEVITDLTRYGSESLPENEYEEDQMSLRDPIERTRTDSAVDESSIIEKFPRLQAIRKRRQQRLQEIWSKRATCCTPINAITDKVNEMNRSLDEAELKALLIANDSADQPKKEEAAVADGGVEQVIWTMGNRTTVSSPKNTKRDETWSREVESLGQKVATILAVDDDQSSDARSLLEDFSRSMPEELSESSLGKKYDEDFDMRESKDEIPNTPQISSDGFEKLFNTQLEMKQSQSLTTVNSKGKSGLLNPSLESDIVEQDCQSPLDGALEAAAEAALEAAIKVAQTDGVVQKACTSSPGSGSQRSKGSLADNVIEGADSDINEGGSCAYPLATGQFSKARKICMTPLMGSSVDESSDSACGHFLRPTRTVDFEGKGGTCSALAPCNERERAPPNGGCMAGSDPKEALDSVVVYVKKKSKTIVESLFSSVDDSCVDRIVGMMDDKAIDKTLRSFGM